MPAQGNTVPEHKFEGRIIAQGPVFGYVAGKTYSLALVFTNQSKEDIVLRSFQVTNAGANGTALKTEPVDAGSKRVPAGATSTASFKVVFPVEAVGRQLTLAGAVEFEHSGQTYSARCEVPAYVIHEFEITLLPGRVILNPVGEPKRVGMSVINHSEAGFAGRITVSATGAIKVAPESIETSIDPFGLEAYVFTVSADKMAVPGHYAAIVDLAGKSKDWVAVDVPAAATRMSGAVVDGRLDEWEDKPKVTIARLVNNTSWHSVGKASFAYDSRSFYVALEIEDDKHFLSPDSKSRVKSDPPSDRVVIGFDTLLDGALAPTGGYKPDDVEYSILGAEGGSVALRTWVRGSRIADGQESKASVGFRREETASFYEVAFPWDELAPTKATPKSMFALSILVVDSDGEGVTSAEWGGGLGEKIDPRKFLPVVLAE